MSEKLPPGTLCVVCEDLATGNHYSVPSCNGCKTFFRRALVNNRQFQCNGNGNCPVNKGVRCACRHCRLQKCLSVGMDRNSIQSGRDRIGYTKRTRKCDKLAGDRDHRENGADDEHAASVSPIPDGALQDHTSSPADLKDVKGDLNSVDPIMERLTALEENFTLLLSRAEIRPYASLDDALAAPSRFNTPTNVKIMDPITCPHYGKDQQPFWRSRIIALYIDWAKTFSCFRMLPHADKVALITNHASSYMIMCEAFRTPEDIDESKIETCMSRINTTPAPETASTLLTVVLNEGVARSFANTLEMKTIKAEPSDDNDMIRLPTEYGSLPADYGGWIPQDYGHPAAGTEGRSDIHMFFDPKIVDSAPKSPAVRPQPHHDSHTNELQGSLLGGLTPVMAAMIDYVMKPFRQLNISTTEFATLQAIMFFDPDTDGIDSASQRNVAAEQKRLLTALHKHISRTYHPKDADERYADILLRIPTIRKVAAKKNESLQMIDMLNLFAINSLVRETALGIRPSNSNTPLLGTSASTCSGGSGGCSNDYPAE